MIVFDLINDEAPLFIEGIKKLISEKEISNENVLGINDGNRWLKESVGLNTVNRLHFFDDLDQKQINLNQELIRISALYDGFNIYACDRYLLRKKRKYQTKMLVYTYLFYEELFKQGVTHYFTTGIAYTYNLISYQVSKRFKVMHISFYGTRIGNRTAVSYDVVNTFDEVFTMFQGFSVEKVTNKMLKSIADFRNKPSQPAYMKNAINASTVKMIFIKEFFVRFDRFYFKKKHRYDLFTRNPYELSSFKLKKIFNAKKIGLLHRSIFDQRNTTDKYFIFPLHMQPEASTLILSPFYVDQKTAIINISKLMPLDTKLYVKEHRSALGQHGLSFYKELKKYPNIRLISYKENMFDLIKNSIGTVNLSSTVGFEALMLKKPSVVLGNVFYNDSGLTFKVSSFLELGELFKIICDKKFNLSDYFVHYDEKLAYYHHCLKIQSYPFEFNVAKLDTKDRVMKPNNVFELSLCLKKLIL